MINYPSFGIRTISGVDFARKATGANWWEVAGKTCVGAWQAKGAASYAASLVDLSGNSKDLTDTGTPGWNSTNGWTGYNTSNYHLTGITLATAYTLIVRFTNATGGSDIAGVQSSPNRMGFRPSNFANRSYWYGSSFSSVAGAIAAGVVALAADQPYRDGSADGGAIGGSITTPTECYLGVANNGGSPAGGGVYIQAAAIYSDTLTAGQVATLSAAMAAL